MKRLFLLLIASLLTMPLMAEGYQINSQSARQLGMGHLGTALKLGSESMLFNPAGLSFIENRYDVSLGVTTIFSKVKYEDNNSNYTAVTDNPVGTPIFGHAGFRLNDRFVVGINLTNPAGNSLTWPDNWKGAHLVQNISLQAFAIQPTVSYKINDMFSVGAGLSINFGSFSMERSLMKIGSLSPIVSLVPSLKPIIGKYDSTPPVTTRLEGRSSVSLGVNLGVLFTPTDRLSIGISYRSKVKMSVDEGTAILSYAGDDLKQAIESVNALVPGAIPIPDISGKKFSASLPIPSNVNVGIAYNFSPRFLLSAELQFVGWKAYDNLTIAFGPDANNLTLVSEKNFKNSMFYRIGGEFICNDKLIWRLGAMYDTTPADLTLYGPETPGANKFSLTTGFTYNVTKILAIDFAFQALFGEKTLGSVADTAISTFSGYYTSTAMIPSLGLRFSF